MKSLKMSYKTFVTVAEVICAQDIDSGEETHHLAYCFVAGRF